jgi:hypothetical protein
MAKFYGKIGYAESSETSPDVWTDVITERNYFGDIVKNTRRLEAGEGLNDNININNLISIVADPFAIQNFLTMRYVEWMGALWKITNVEVQRPRLILTIGGVYNGPTPSIITDPQRSYDWD